MRRAIKTPGFAGAPWGILVNSAEEEMTAAALRADQAAPQRAANGDGRKAPPRRAPDVGEALRAVYRDAVAEQVPDEMLDLLNKLG